MPPHDSIDVTMHFPGVSIVTLRGEHDLASRREVAIALTVAAGCSNILVDLLDTSFIDCSVIRAILTASRLARQRGGTLELVTSARSASRRALQLSGVQTLIKFHETRSAGVTSIEATAQLREPDRRVARSDLQTVIAAKINHLHARNEADRAQLTAERLGIIVRAHIADQAAPDREERPAAEFT
ncbi:MAG: hypothetical protein QOI02_1310 [Actinomycetota bacterium]|nr:hypothetical protein [Actinomycetota bacterium]